MKYEVIEKATGAKMSHSRAVEMMGSVLFDSRDAAQTWMENMGLTTKTHEIREAQ